MFCENCPRLQSTSGYLAKKRIRSRQTSTTSTIPTHILTTFPQAPDAPGEPPDPSTSYSLDRCFIVAFAQLIGTYSAYSYIPFIIVLPHVQTRHFLHAICKILPFFAYFCPKYRLLDVYTYRQHGINPTSHHHSCTSLSFIFYRFYRKLCIPFVVRLPPSPAGIRPVPRPSAITNSNKNAAIFGHFCTKI